ncbi:MAG: glycosyltransferase [Candidatus Omnitrophica bacterium]|nr:glycosyltransferase [Candidatus Omnitrophota bacterium]
MKVVILITTYNSSKTIVETLDSIKKQDCSSLNEIQAIYIADDGSSDDTVIKAENNWNLNKPPLYIIKRPFNIGQSNNMNQAIEILSSDTDWILLVHADNIAKSDWLKVMLSQIKNCPDNVASISSSYDDLLEDGRIIHGEDNNLKDREIIVGNKDSIRGTLLRGCWWHFSHSALRIKAFKDIGYFDKDFKQKNDWDWLLRCLYKGWSIKYIPRTLFLYRHHRKSVSSKNFIQNIDIKETLRIINKYINIISKKSILYLHYQSLEAVIRRLLKSIVKFNLIRLFFCIEVLFIIFLNLLQCLYKKLHNQILD